MKNLHDDPSAARRTVGRLLMALLLVSCWSHNCMRKVPDLLPKRGYQNSSRSNPIRLTCAKDPAQNSQSLWVFRREGLPVEVLRRAWSLAPGTGF